MNLSQLLELAAYHKAKAEDLAKAASLMGDCPTAQGFFAESDKHLGWALELHEFAAQLRDLATVYLKSELP